MCENDGAGVVTCGVEGTGSDCSTSGLIPGTSSFLSGAQDACTCSANVIQPCNRPRCTVAAGAPTCPNGATVYCSGYDSTTTDATDRVHVCSSIGAPRDHLGNVLSLPANVACVASNMQTCAAIAVPALRCTDATTLAPCANNNGIMTCDNRAGMTPICSVRPGVSALHGGNVNAAQVAQLAGNFLCTGNAPNSCAACNAAGTAAECAAAGQDATCTNYHSSSEIIPAPICIVTANRPALFGEAICTGTIATGGTVGCAPIAAPTCAAGATGAATCATPNTRFTCTGVAAGEKPVCSAVPGALEYATANACTNGELFNCGEEVAPFCDGATDAAPFCPAGTTRTCTGTPTVTTEATAALPTGQSEVCSRRTMGTLAQGRIVARAAACAGSVAAC